MQKGSACRATGKASHGDYIVDVFVICLLNSTDDIAAYAICFDFCYYHQPSQTGQNSSRVSVDTRHAGSMESRMLLR